MGVSSQFHALAALSSRRGPQYQLNKGLSWSQSWYGCLGEEKSLAPNQELNHSSSAVQPTAKTLY